MTKKNGQTQELQIPERVLMPMFTPITAPKLKSFSLEAVNRFSKAFEAYEDAVRERRDVHLEDVYANSLKSCIDKKELKGVAKYTLKKPIDKITNYDIPDHYETILGRSATQAATDIEKLIAKKIIMSLKEKDVETRVRSMFATFDQLIEDYGLLHVYGDDKDGQKRAVKV